MLIQMDFKVVSEMLGASNWHNDDTWPTYKMPVEWEKMVVIEAHMHVVLDRPTVRIGKLLIKGKLEFVEQMQAEEKCICQNPTRPCRDNSQPENSLACKQ
jgi:hypothetical protein